VAALRFHNVYGPGMPRHTPYAGVASLFRASLEQGRPAQVFEDGRQRRNFVHVTDVAALIREGITAGLIRDDDPLLLARGVVGIVGLYSHFHRTGRSDVPIDELAQFVGRWVVRSLAADDEIARSVERDGSRTRAAQTAIGPSGRG